MKKKKKKSKLNTVINIFLVLILLAGLSLLLYPTFSDLWNSTRQSKAISSYAKEVAKLTKEDYTKLWEDARAYNAGILERYNLYLPSEEEEATYQELLNISENGIMAYIDIPKINIKLPIYHGTSESVLQVAIGHIEWSSLPIGGESTHCIVSGHRGLPSAKLFTDLDEMVVGDQFYIHVLDQTLAYEVDQINIVLPEELENLMIEEGQDYVTLVTCTPYGINTHRMLVRGHRIDYEEPETETESETVKEVVVVENLTENFIEMAKKVFTGLAVLILFMANIFRKKKK